MSTELTPGSVGEILQAWRDLVGWRCNICTDLLLGGINADPRIAERIDGDELERGGVAVQWVCRETYPEADPTVFRDLADGILRVWLRHGGVMTSDFSPLSDRAPALKAAGLPDALEFQRTADRSFELLCAMENRQQNAAVAARERSAVDPRFAPVTLSQVATLAKCSKRLLENAKRDGRIPPPDFPASGPGKANRWRWDTLRPAVQKMVVVPPPEKFPDWTQK